MKKQDNKTGNIQGVKNALYSTIVGLDKGTVNVGKAAEITKASQTYINAINADLICKSKFGHTVDGL